MLRWTSSRSAIRVFLKSIAVLIWCAFVIICTWSLATRLMCLTEDWDDDHDDVKCLGTWNVDFATWNIDFETNVLFVIRRRVLSLTGKEDV